MFGSSKWTIFCSPLRHPRYWSFVINNSAFFQFLIDDKPLSSPDENPQQKCSIQLFSGGGGDSITLPFKRYTLFKEGMICASLLIRASRCKLITRDSRVFEMKIPRCTAFTPQRAIYPSSSASYFNSQVALRSIWCLQPADIRRFLVR